MGELIRVATIRLDGGTQSRACLSEETIVEYAERIAGGEKFPPIVVFYDGADHWLADGFHRVHGHLRSGVDLISADVRQGTRRDAILFSVGANSAHGLRRTNADKRRSVETLLRDDEWRRWPNREIARQCGVSPGLVDQLRRDVPTVGTSPAAEPPKRMDTIGRMQPATKPATQPKREPQIAPVVADVIDAEAVERPQSAPMSFDEEAEEAGHRMYRHVMAFVDESLVGVDVGPTIRALRQCIALLEMQQRKQGRAA